MASPRGYLVSVLRQEPIDRLRLPFLRFVRAETNAGLLLLGSALVALIWANSPWRAEYHALWEHVIAIRFDRFELKHDLREWINDGLMAVFFFVVGLELKREMIGGRLARPSTALLPIAAALGGMLVPALIYIATTGWSGPATDGWGIPVATDIAFAVGILALLGSRAPVGLKVFLTTLAIADDLGAVLVIALFYTSELSLINLGIGLLFLLVLMGGNRLGARSPLFYGIVGIAGMWTAFLLSGVHATVAGVLAAFTIPAAAKVDEQGYIKRLRKYIAEFAQLEPAEAPPITEEQLRTTSKVIRISEHAAPPLQRLEHSLRPVVLYLIVPLFALANAGVEIPADLGGALMAPVAMGVALGLSIGKPVGILLVCWLVSRTRLVRVGDEFSWHQLIGAAMLAGIGFTMSLFINGLAFADEQLRVEAQLGILAGSLVSGVAGALVLRAARKPDPPDQRRAP
ncbi:MAG: Na+/H+ antiporter NhaA [Flavobacteriales bacterium]|nr:Na+/H+ antiporter NhaA [Flavobacteriales bacterium]